MGNNSSSEPDLFDRIFGKPKPKPRVENPTTAINQLQNTFDILQKSIENDELKIENNKKRIQKFMGEGNKTQAMIWLKTNKLLGTQIEQNSHKMLGLQQQILAVGQATLNYEMINNMATTASALNVMSKHLDVDNAQDIIYEMDEQVQNINEITESLINPSFGVEFDEHDLENELEGYMMEDEPPVIITNDNINVVEDIEQQFNRIPSIPTNLPSALVQQSEKDDFEFLEQEFLI